MTYRQAVELGAQVRGGEKGTTVVFTKKLRIKDKDTEEEKNIGMLRTYVVFNSAQIDGLPGFPVKPAVLIPPFIEATKAEIRYGPQPMFVPSKDFIAMPQLSDFKDEAHYYATLLHEAGHWTGAKHRLDPDLEGRFCTRKYAAEELVAELTAAFLCAHLGIRGELRHAGYIDNWLELLRHDNRAVFTAASKAQHAADYLRGFSETEQEEAA
jgi:antirestriction protein ArdC